VLALQWSRGEVWLLGAQRKEWPAPRETARAMGRFALELFEGPTLVERVRFSFPLLGADDEPGGGAPGASSLSRALQTQVSVYFPATPRGTRLELVDRASRHRWSMPWPPPAARRSAPSAPSAADAAPAHL
jgi:hypothetical protein